MPFGSGPRNLEMMLGGSNVAFKIRQHASLSAEQQELKLQNERRLQEGLYLLRKLRTCALEEQNADARQYVLKEAHYLSDQMAQVIISQVANDKHLPIEPSFLETLAGIGGQYRYQEADSGHALHPQFSISNLFRAGDDIFVRIEEQAQSVYAPDHKLTREEMIYVLQEFLRGTNDLAVNAIERIFDGSTRLGGILSGGSVFTEMARRVIEIYGDPSLAVYSFVIAVDKDTGRSAFETSKSDKDTQTVLILDDVIDGGGTVLTAIWAAGEYFPNATIHSGMGTDYAGGFEKRRVEKHMGHLCGLFQDFADLAEIGRKYEALTIFQQAEEYAQGNEVRLQPGWYRIRERLASV